MPKPSTFPDFLDEVKNIDLAALKSMGYLRPDAIVSGPYRWTRGGKPSGWIKITVSLPDRYAELDYLSNGEPVNYRVEREPIKTHFGDGFTWYFRCPATGRRCRKLYGLGKFFLSRYAYPSAMYSSQAQSKHTREFLKAFRALDLRRDFLAKRHSRTTYRGKLTKRYLRILNRESRNANPDSLKRFLDR